MSAIRVIKPATRPIEYPNGKGLSLRSRQRGSDLEFLMESIPFALGQWHVGAIVHH